MLRGTWPDAPDEETHSRWCLERLANSDQPSEAATPCADRQDRDDRQPEGRLILPFDRTGKIKHGTTEIADIDFAAWPLGQPAETPAGEAYDFTGECPEDAADHLIGEPNMRIAETDGETYQVIGASLNRYIPHIELQLRVMRSG